LNVWQRLNVKQLLTYHQLAFETLKIATIAMICRIVSHISVSVFVFFFFYSSSNEHTWTVLDEQNFYTSAERAPRSNGFRKNHSSNFKRDCACGIGTSNAICTQRGNDEAQSQTIWTEHLGMLLATETETESVSAIPFSQPSAPLEWASAGGCS